MHQRPPRYLPRTNTIAQPLANAAKPKQLRLCHALSDEQIARLRQVWNEIGHYTDTPTFLDFCDAFAHDHPQHRNREIAIQEQLSRAFRAFMGALNPTVDYGQKLIGGLCLLSLHGPNTPIPLPKKLADRLRKAYVRVIREFPIAPTT